MLFNFNSTLIASTNLCFLEIRQKLLYFNFSMISREIKENFRINEFIYVFMIVFRKYKKHEMIRKMFLFFIRININKFILTLDYRR